MLPKPEIRLDSHVAYVPGLLFDAMLNFLGLRSDAELARVIGVSASFLSKMRSGSIPVGASTLFRLHEATGLHTRKLRALMGDHRAYFCVPHSALTRKSPLEAGRPEV